MNFRKLLTYLTVSTAAVIPFAGAQNPTILQGSYISNVFGNSNFVKNPNAQTNVANVTNATRSITTPLVATSEFNLNLTSGTFATWTLRAFDAGMKGQNCEARFSYRGFATATSTAEIVQNSLVVAQLVLTPSTDPRIASINFPCGDLVNATTFRIAQTTANMTGTNEIGGIYVGLATNMANVAQAEFVGGGEWQTASGFTRSSAAIQSTFAAYTVGIAGTALGKATSAGTDTTITFPYLPAGQYFVTTNMYNYMAFGGVAFANCEFSLEEIDSNTKSGYGSSGAFVTTNIYPSAASLQGNFNFTTGSQRRFRIVSKNTAANGAGSQCASGQNADAKTGISVYRFPSSSELVVTPERQNTWAGVVYTNQTQSLFAGTAEPTAQSPYTNATWNQPTLLKGKAAVTTTNSGNDLGFSISNLPVGSYKLDVTGLLNASVGGGTTTGTLTICNFKLVETTTSTDVARQTHQDQQYGASVGNETRNYVNAFTGVFTNTSVATRNFRIEAQKHTDTTTGNIGNCQAFSAISAGNNSNIAIIMSPLDQPSNSALYVQGPVLGSQTGAAIPAGYVGELKYAITSSATNWPVTSGNWGTLNSVVLPVGVWSCTGTVNILRNGANFSGPTVNYITVSFSEALNSNATYSRSYHQTSFELAITNAFDSVSLPIRPITLRSNGSQIIWPDGTARGTTTLYLNSFLYNWTAGTPQHVNVIECTRLN